MFISLTASDPHKKFEVTGSNNVFITQGDNSVLHYYQQGMEHRNIVNFTQETVKGLHDVVPTYTRTILPRPLVSFLYGVV